MKVVICDNERMTTEYLNTLLQKKENIEILGIFTSQVEFLQMMEHRKIPDVVFMDIDWKDDINVNSATAGKILKTLKAGCSAVRTRTKSQMY